MGQIPIHWGTARGKGVQEISLAATICIAISSHMQTDDSAVHCKFFTDLIVRLSALWLCALLLSALFSHLELGRSVAYSRTWRCLRNSSWRWPKACSTASSLRFKHVVRILLIGNLYSRFHCKYIRTCFDICFWTSRLQLPFLDKVAERVRAAFAAEVRKTKKL